MSRTACRSKQALLCGLRPNSPTAQKIQCGVCPYRCIYCDIWKLATLISSRVPTKLQRSPSNSPPSSPRASFEWERNERAIEAQFQQQRARLASIMSICTAEGAEECEGLRIAHDRCLGSVTDLLLQEQMLQQQQCTCSRSPSRSQRRPETAIRSSKGCGEGRGYYQDERRPSSVGMAM